MSAKSLQRRLLSAALALALAAVPAIASTALAETVDVPAANLAETSLCTLYVNGAKRTSKPFYQGRTLMLPLRAVVDTGADWHYAYGSKTSVFGPHTGTEFSVTIGKNAYKYGGKTHELDCPPLFVDDRVYVPWQYMEFALGFKVTIAVDGKIDVNTKTATSAAALNLSVNGRRVNGTPYYSGETLMVPLRPIVTALGYTYGYSNEGRYSVFSAKGVNTHIFWGVNSYPIDNKYAKLSKSPELKGGSLYVPTSYITNALKCKVTKSGSTIRFSR